MLGSMAAERKYELFCAKYDRIKIENRDVFTNIYLDFNAIKEFFITKTCIMHEDGNCLLLLVLRHDSFYELFYICDAYTSLHTCIYSLLRLNICFPVRATIAGKDEKHNNKLVTCFSDNGFYLAKKMIRTRSKRPKEEIIEAMRVLAGDLCRDVSFANENDAYEVLALLTENFDIIKDNIPEYEDIVENINKNQVTILRQDGKIASLHYFTIHNNILHGYFDVTRKEFRGAKALFLAIAIFEYDYFKARNMNVARAIGWRDVTNSRLIKYADRSSQKADGVYVYNMLWLPDMAAAVEV